MGPNKLQVAQCVAKNWIPAQLSVERMIAIRRKTPMGFSAAVITCLNMMSPEWVGE